MTIQQAFDNFMSSDFKSAVDSSTEASWGGGAYAVELFEDGTYRTMPKSSIGNRYDSPGVILAVPQFDEEEWDDDPDVRSYDNAEECMKGLFEHAMWERAQPNPWDSWPSPVSA
jgi:hypothetical protein